MVTKVSADVQVGTHCNLTVKEQNIDGRQKVFPVLLSEADYFSRNNLSVLNEKLTAKRVYEKKNPVEPF